MQNENKYNRPHALATNTLIQKWLSMKILLILFLASGLIGLSIPLIQRYLRKLTDAKKSGLDKRKDPIELNEYGLAVWRHIENKNLFVERAYRWCDRVIVLDEFNSRLVVDDTLFSTFDFSDWIPVGREEFKKVKQNFKDIYQ